VFETIRDATEHFWHFLSEIEVLPLLAGIGCQLLKLVCTSRAWRNVLAAAYPERRVRLLYVGAAYAIGVALNAVLPGRGGDAAKVVLVRSRIPGSSVPMFAATMSVIVLFDMVAATLLVLVVCLTGAVPFAPSLPAPSAVAVLAAVLVVLVVVVGALTAPRLASRLRTLRRRIAQGGAILRTPRRYARQVVLVQAGAWTCRIAVVFFLLAAFQLPASIPTAGLVMVVAGLSTLVPLTPGGAGTQQAMLAYALRQTASAAGAVSFSVGMQAGVTVVNALLGVVAAMVAFRTLRPLTAARSGLNLLGTR
jgi:uncharacterized membrane protein YbhN (UPF0104 family)